ncbi:MAG TPA: phospholipase D family protein [Candidatus Nanoarchaeia archaeon]|nr:phospholipase D family protein [Candidatus Nanoarchaeia archaeon]
MAKFLDTTGVSNELAQIIKGAKEKLILISPYLQISDRFKEMLEDQDRMKLDIRIVYGKSELQPQESNWLKSLKSVRTSICKNLHAKCYLNEKEALISSMNFYEFSQMNNNEMGIAVYKSEDAQLYSDVDEEARRLIRIGEEIKVTVEKVILKAELSQAGNGHCIRCGIGIKIDPEHPYCLTDYQKWKKYEDATYVEKKGFCHICGKPHTSSMEKPACMDCYKKNKKLF